MYSKLLFPFPKSIVFSNINVLVNVEIDCRKHINHLKLIFQQLIDWEGGIIDQDSFQKIKFTLVIKNIFFPRSFLSVVEAQP